MMQRRCKERHCQLLQSKKAPELFGMDCYSLFESKDALIKFLEAHDSGTRLLLL